MRQLLVAFVATAALVASHNSAQAIFVKNLVDNFEQPAGQHASNPTGTGSAVYDFLPADDSEAVSRTLKGAPSPQPALVAGGGPLTISLASSNDGGMPATLSYDLGSLADPLSLASAMATNSAVYLVLVNTTFDDGGTVEIEAIDDSGSLGLVTYSGEDDAILSWARPLVATSSLSFVFDAGTSGFSGSVQSVVANPEPATMALMGLGVLGGAIGYRRRRKDDAVVPVDV